MSNELIKVAVKDDRQLVRARDLYKGLGFKGRFSRWADNNFGFFTENDDFYKCTSIVAGGNGAKQKVQDYALTIDMAKQLCLFSRTPKGKELHKYLSGIEKKQNDPQNVIQKTCYLDVILGTTSAIATAQIAMDYGYTAVEFNKLLHELGIRRKFNGQWVLYKAYMGKKYTTPKIYLCQDKHGNGHVKAFTAWTQKGRYLIYDVLKENGILPLIERENID